MLNVNSKVGFAYVREFVMRFGASINLARWHFDNHVDIYRVVLRSPTRETEMYTTQLDALLTHVGIGADVEFIDIQRFNPQTGHYVQVAWFTTPWFRWWFSYDLNVPVDGLVHVEYDEQVDVHQLRQYIADMAKHNDAEDVWVSWYMGGNPRVLHKLSLASLELPF